MLPVKQYIPDPAKYIGKWVRATTYTHTVWRVIDAYIHHGVVVLSLSSEDGSTFWRSDHEHATLLPYKYQGPGVEAVRDPQTREIEWDD